MGFEVVLASLYKVFGASAYNIVAIATGSLCLAVTALYARTLGAHRGRLALIVMLMAVGISDFVIQDRGLSFSLIWLPLELFFLTKARANPAMVVVAPTLVLAVVEHPRVDPRRALGARH